MQPQRKIEEADVYKYLPAAAGNISTTWKQVHTFCHSALPTNVSGRYPLLWGRADVENCALNGMYERFIIPPISHLLLERRPCHALVPPAPGQDPSTTAAAPMPPFEFAPNIMSVADVFADRRVRSRQAMKSYTATFTRTTRAVHVGRRWVSYGRFEPMVGCGRPCRPPQLGIFQQVSPLFAADDISCGSRQEEPCRHYRDRH